MLYGFAIGVMEEGNSGEPCNSYEIQRQNRIRNNLALLRSLGFPARENTSSTSNELQSRPRQRVVPRQVRAELLFPPGQPNLQGQRLPDLRHVQEVEPSRLSKRIRRQPPPEAKEIQVCTSLAQTHLLRRSSYGVVR